MLIDLAPREYNSYLFAFHIRELKATLRQASAEHFAFAMGRSWTLWKGSCEGGCVHVPTVESFTERLYCWIHPFLQCVLWFGHLRTKESSAPPELALLIRPPEAPRKVFTPHDPAKGAVHLKPWCMRPVGIYPLVKHAAFMREPLQQSNCICGDAAVHVQEDEGEIGARSASGGTHKARHDDVHDSLAKVQLTPVAGPDETSLKHFDEELRQLCGDRKGVVPADAQHVNALTLKQSLEDCRHISTTAII
mmetsp:Transcript_101230/g.194001  ORF Transcript_101230/g.194001 Transcript_101230/m.194001 type:complete len:249 (-) Transcript_101230:86-832(-)